MKPSEYHSSWPKDARDYFENVILSHGGWAAWESFDSIHFKLNHVHGLLMFAKGFGRSFFNPEQIRVRPKERRVDFIYPSGTDTFENGKVSFAGKTVADGRSLFTKSNFEQWKPEHAAYFFGYAWANYIGYPFILPQFELVSYKIGSSKSIFVIRFPEGFHTHCRVQTFFFNSEFKLYRHDYQAEFAGSLVYGAHYTRYFKEYKGVQIGYIRQVRGRAGALVLPGYGIYGEMEFIK